MKFSQLLTAPNQLTLLRMMFVPFIVIDLVAGHYKWALILFVLAGFSDGLDGLLARTLKQQTVLGQYLDPIADKLLLSTMFMVLAILHKIAWKYTVLVFSRDIQSVEEGKLRQALALSIDRAAINDVLLQGGGEPAQVGPGREDPLVRGGEHDAVDVRILTRL